MEKLEIIFFIIIFLTVYSYVIYPCILYILSCFFDNTVSYKDNSLPLTLIISAFNEEDVIEDKIKNCLELDYPNDLLEIIVVSDNSTDNTDKIVKSYEDKGVVLLSPPERRGKTSGLNAALLQAKGEIVVFTDADAIFPRSTLKKMLASFANPEVGLVTGSTEYYTESSDEMVETSGIYTKLERYTKFYESKIGSCVGADGAVFAIRKKLYKPLRDDDINDLVIPLNIVQQNYRVILNEDITCSETASSSSKNEFNRQIRITNRTLRAVFRHADLFNFFKYPFFSFELLSHKLIRLSIPFFLISLVPLNIILLQQSLLYSFIFMVQVLFYLVALYGFFQDRLSNKTNITTFVYHFILIQLSILIGWINYFLGKKQVTLNPGN